MANLKKWSGHQICLTKNNFVYTILCKLFQLMSVRRIIHLAGSERGGVLKISEFFFLE